MKILIQSIMFIAIVSIFAITSDRLSKIESSSSMPNSTSKSDSTMGDKEFLADIIAHHHGAIVMAKVARLNSDRPEILKFAGDIIAMESGSIEQAYVWRRDWFDETSYIFPDRSDKKITMVKDLGGKDGKFDLRFLDAMIAHHEGAISMLNGILVPTTKTEIHNTASAGIIALSKDIETMKGWKKEWYGK